MAKDEPDGEEPLYEIERLIDHRKIGNKEEYLVCWLGYDEDEDTWEPRSSLEETAMDAITEYHRYD
jgi:chromobox protein 1